MTFDQFVVHAESLWPGMKKLHQRKGQHLMNCLDHARTDLFHRVTGMEGIDPFYNDENITRFWNWVANNWEKK